MAKRRTKVDRAKRGANLARPFPSAPRHAGEYDLYITGPGETPEGQCCVFIFASKYAAKKFLEALVEDDQVILESDKFLKTSSGIRVRHPKLNEIWAHEYTKAEAEWVLPEPYPSQAYAIRYGAPKVSYAKKVEEQRKSERDMRRKANKPKRRRRPKEGVVTIGDLADELDMTAREARGILRKAKEPKPEMGWAWADGDDEIARIRDLLKARK